LLISISSVDVEDVAVVADVVEVVKGDIYDVVILGAGFGRGLLKLLKKERGFANCVKDFFSDNIGFVFATIKKTDANKNPKEASSKNEVSFLICNILTF